MHETLNPADLRNFAADLHNLLRDHEDLQGADCRMGNKVLILPVYFAAQFGGTKGAQEGLSAFRKNLLAAMAQGLLVLARADIPKLWKDADLLADSAMVDGRAQFHCIIDPSTYARDGFSLRD